MFRDGYDQQAARLKALMTDNSQGIVPEREYEIGRILSYTDDEIAVYLDHVSTQKG